MLPSIEICSCNSSRPAAGQWIKTHTDLSSSLRCCPVFSVSLVYVFSVLVLVVKSNARYQTHTNPSCRLHNQAQVSRTGKSDDSDDAWVSDWRLICFLITKSLNINSPQLQVFIPPDAAGSSRGRKLQELFDRVAAYSKSPVFVLPLQTYYLSDICIENCIEIYINNSLKVIYHLVFSDIPVLVLFPWFFSVPSLRCRLIVSL